MFHNIPAEVLERMRRLEEIDRADRVDGTAHERRLRQVSPETGRLLAILACTTPPGAWIEIGTSAGYSALWISLAGREMDRRLTTFEILAEKAALARETIVQAGVERWVELIEGDGLAGLTGMERVAFCFLDADKPRAQVYLDLLLARLAPGALFVFDNAISHRERIAGFLERVEAEPRLDSVLVPIGKGVLVCRRALDPPSDQPGG